MDLVISTSKKQKKALLGFYKSQYVNNPLRRDSFSGVLKGILFETSVMSRSIEMLPLVVRDGASVVMSCVLAKASRMDSYLQIAFFESKGYHVEAFELIYDKAIEMASKWGVEKISASLNIHVNYGLGFLADSYDQPQSFGLAHNDAHIHRYFEAYGFQAIPMVSFHKNMDADFDLISDKLRERINKRYNVRHADFSNLEEEARLYTEINNNAFEHHPFYYERIASEDLELFKDFKMLLKPENLLFVEKDHKAVGFMLWYPDFHQIMAPNETIGVRTVIKSKILRNKLTRFKLVEMGVVKEEQKKGAILALFDYCFSLTKNRYKIFESGWVLKDNLRSGNFGYKWSDGVEKNFVAYEKEL